MAEAFEIEFGYTRRFNGIPLLYGEPNGGVFLIRPFFNDRKPQRKTYDNPKRSALVTTVDGVPVRTLFVGNLPLEATNRDLLNIFARFGRIDKVNIVSSTRNEPRKTTFGFVTFSTSQEATRALRAKQHLKVYNKKVYVNPADSWHQPVEENKGKWKWRKNSNCNIKSDSEEDEKEEDDVLEQDEESCPMLKLNDDCLHAIFSYIPINQRHIIGSICRRWRYITNLMWSSVRKLDFSKPPLDQEILTLPCLRRYVNLCENLTSLNLAQDSHYLNSSAIATVAKGCKNLEELKFSNINLHSRSLALLARYCPNLKTFYMDGCSNCHDGEMIALITKCTQLQKIGMRFGISLHGKWLKYLNCPLETLTLQLCEFSPDYLIEGINKVKDTIKTLGFTSCISLRCNDLDIITETVPNLTSLTLAGSYPDFKAHTLSPISRLSNLTELNLERNNVVCDEFIQDLLEHCPRIHNINLSATEGSLLSAYGLCLVGKFPELIEVHLSYLSKLTDQVLKTIANRATKLRHVNIVGCKSITDEGCISLFSHCHSLEHLDVSGCSGVTKKTVMFAAETAQIENKKQKLTLCIGGSGIELDKDWSSPYITIDSRKTCLPFMNQVMGDHFLLVDDEDDIANFGAFPDPLDEIYDLDELDIYDPYDVFDEYSLDDTEDSEESLELF